MADEKDTNVTATEAKEDGAREAAEEQHESSRFETFRNKVSSLLSEATTIGKSIAGSVKETVTENVEKGRDAYEELRRERDADKIYVKLGRKIYKLVSRQEIELPESCDKYIEALKELYASAVTEPAAEEEAGCCGGGDCCCCSAAVDAAADEKPAEDAAADGAEA